MRRISSSYRSFVPILFLFLVVSRLAATAENADDLEDPDELDDLEELEAEMTVSEDVKIVGRAQKFLRDLNDQTVHRVIDTHKYVLLLGYATWCTRSADLMPGFAAAATVLADEGSPVLLAKIDAIANPGAANRYGIKGFPSFLFFTNGTVQQHTGGHTRDEFVNWVRKRTGLPARTVSSKVEAQAILDRNSTLVVGYFEKFEGVEYAEFIAVAKEEDGSEFLQISDPEVAKLFKSIASSVSPAVGLQKPEPENLVTHGGSFTKKDISYFVEVNKYPLVNKLSSKNMGKVYSSPIQHQVLLFSSVEDNEALRPVFSDVALQYKGKIIFIFVDVADEDLSMPMLAVYGLGAEKAVVTAFHNGIGSKHVLEAEVTRTNLENFCDDLLAGRLPVYQKSEPVPEENDGVVKTVVGKTYSAFMSDETKDLFLQVYTPWCVACEKVNKSFHKVANHLRDVPSIVFAKIDASANEHPDLTQVHNFPALLFYPSGEGPRTPVRPAKHTSKELLQFLRKHSSVPFTVPDLPTSQKRGREGGDADKNGPSNRGDAVAGGPHEFKPDHSVQKSDSVISESLKDEL